MSLEGILSFGMFYHNVLSLRWHLILSCDDFSYIRLNKALPFSHFVAISMWPAPESVICPSAKWSLRFIARLVHPEITWCSHGFDQRHQQKVTFLRSRHLGGNDSQSSYSKQWRTTSCAFYLRLISAAPCGFEAPPLKPSPDIQVSYYSHCLFVKI